MIKKLVSIFLENYSYIKELISNYQNIDNLDDNRLIEIYIDLLRTEKDFTDRIQVLYEKKYGINENLNFDWGAVISAGSSLFNSISQNIKTNQEGKNAKEAAKAELEAQQAALQLAIQNAKNEKEKAKNRNKTIRTIAIFSTIVVLLIGSVIIGKEFIEKKSK